MQVKTTVRYQFISVRMATIEKTKNNNSWLGCKVIGILVYYWWECKMVQLLQKIMIPPETKIDLPYDPAVPLLGIYSKELKAES